MESARIIRWSSTAHGVCLNTVRSICTPVCFCNALSCDLGGIQVDTPDSVGLEYEDLELTTADGVRLNCFFIEAAVQSAARQQMFLHYRYRYQADGDSSAFRPPTTYDAPAVANVIIFHGNAMNAGDCIPQAQELVMRRCNVLLLSYRGYGHSGGVPSELGLQRDAQAALDYVTANSRTSALPTILFGASLGGAVAIDLASRNPTAISGLIIENTFLSIPRLIRRVPYVGLILSSIVMQPWNSAEKLPRVPATVPLLFLSGTWDQVVPRQHMEGLWEIRKQAASELDRFESFPYGHNNTSAAPGYWDKVGGWLQSVIQPKP
ncbi:Hydrolase-4 domain-containing protein [Mycena indigotica]|uniref:Hydrolase-4 domain-containing protein n=1 Tax=Mycena indigotica TaxID=2126181 RepID=A0A8H6T6N5_9AGAR|nr:Hydrolase-4 domain-containing protein [Mycena indigotica]KAF7312763.1 Hydrolase-4 domain-containing protein [Mycena indigotica]